MKAYLRVKTMICGCEYARIIKLLLWGALRFIKQVVMQINCRVSIGVWIDFG